MTRLRKRENRLTIIPGVVFAGMLAILVGTTTPGCSKLPDGPPLINLWYGLEQIVGNQGPAQADVNLLGNVQDKNGVALLTYRLNDAVPETLSIGRGAFGDDRRLAAPGDFNADIPLTRLQSGENTVTLTAVDSTGEASAVQVSLNYLPATRYELPATIQWEEVGNLQEVGHAVDGRWGLTNAGLRTLETGYDRIFLIGDTTWQDYEVTVPVTIHRVDQETGPVSGANGLGLLMRFKGHAVGTYRNWPDAQPKWGYQPFGSIGWFRWMDGPDEPAARQFYRGDANHMENFGTVPIQVGATYWLKMRAETLPDSDAGHGVTRYAWKSWPYNAPEPDAWSFEFTQTSEHALRRGGVVLLAHHVDATFGDVQIRALDP